MNETHLEQQPESLETAIADLKHVVVNLTTEQELRQTALAYAIQVFLKPSKHQYDDIIACAEAFHAFLSKAG